MEVYGLYSAAAMAKKSRPVHLAIKSVRDFGDESKLQLGVSVTPPA